jgi:hypothetical protein
MLSTLTIPTAFSALTLRSGSVLSDNPHIDEPLWDINGRLHSARDLHLYPPVFRRLFEQFKSLTAESPHVSPWSVHGAHRFLSGLTACQDQWIPVARARDRRPDCAGIIALQTTWVCSIAAQHALEYPHTRSYPIGSPERQGQEHMLTEVVAMHWQLLLAYRDHDPSSAE